MTQKPSTGPTFVDAFASVSATQAMAQPAIADDILGPTRLGEMLSNRHAPVDLDLVERLTGVSPELVLSAYEYGQFPMAEDRHAAKLSWIEPSERGVIKLSQFQVPKRLARTVKSSTFDVTCDLAFDAVVESCGSAQLGRQDTWINDQIRILYGALHRLGFAHSIEVWEDSQLVGGLYGIAMHGTFFGESMFSVRRDASKIALVQLAARMAKSQMSLLDCQFYTRHLGQFGAIEIPEESYLEILEATMDDGSWFEGGLTQSELNAFLWNTTAQKKLPL